MSREPSASGLLKRLLAAREGNVALTTALALPLIAGGAAYGVETTFWYYRDLQLQSAADAAAYAAAVERRAGRDAAGARAAALAAATGNGFRAGRGTIVVNTPPEVGPNRNPRAVEVILTERQDRYFSKVFTRSAATAHARSVAVFQDASNACVLALDPAASSAVSFGGSSDVRLTGCSVMANSISDQAVTMQGATRLAAECLIASGGISTTANLTLACPSPVTQAPVVADPFADLQAPSTAGSCRPSSGGTLQPGVYCGGLTLQNSVRLNPGVYVISGGDLRINANASVLGEGVTFYLTGGARLRMNGNATVDFSAPSTGAYAGVLFFGDRADTGTSRNTVNGTAASRMTGAIYFPTQPVEYLGNFSGRNGCTQVVGRTVAWSGNTTVNVDCSAFGMRAMPAQQLVRIVE